MSAEIEIAESVEVESNNGSLHPDVTATAAASQQAPVVSPKDEEPPAPLEVERTGVLGVGISAINIPMAIDVIFDAVEHSRQGYVCVTGVHGVMESQSNAVFRDTLNNSLLTTPDGMPMVWLSKLAGQSHVDRVYGPDLMLELLRQGTPRGLRHFLFGGAPGVAEKLADGLREKVPGVNIVGTHTPPFRPLTEEEEADLAEEVHRAQPDCFWIGLSTPKQEKFMAEHIGKLDATVMLGVGAAFDFHAGLVSQAPRWIQRSGFEWLFRLVMEPRRLWKRYLVNNTAFLGLLFRKFITRGRLTDRE